MPAVILNANETQIGKEDIALPVLCLVVVSAAADILNMRIYLPGLNQFNAFELGK